MALRPVHRAFRCTRRPCVRALLSSQYRQTPRRGAAGRTDCRVAPSLTAMRPDSMRTNVGLAAKYKPSSARIAAARHASIGPLSAPAHTNSIRRSYEYILPDPFLIGKNGAVRRLAKPVPRCVGAPVIRAADMHTRFFTRSAGNSASSNTTRFLATMNSLIGGVMMTVTVVFLFGITEWKRKRAAFYGLCRHSGGTVHVISPFHHSAYELLQCLRLLPFGS